MKEITTADANLLETFNMKNRAYKTGVYAFTFERAYLIYYYKRGAGKGRFRYDYLAADIRTGSSSHICSRQSVLSRDYFSYLIPDILRSIKHTGDKRNVKELRN